MVLLTMIGRSEDGLLLSASGINDSDFSGNNSVEYQNQAKQLFKTLRADSPPQMTIETGPYVFHYLLENRICYLCLCDKAFSKRLAFSYLEELATEFQHQYGQRLYTVTRPYSFIEFGKWDRILGNQLARTSYDMLLLFYWLSVARLLDYWSILTTITITFSHGAHSKRLDWFVHQTLTCNPHERSSTQPGRGEISTCSAMTYRMCKG